MKPMKLFILVGAIGAIGSLVGSAIGLTASNGARAAVPSISPPAQEVRVKLTYADSQAFADRPLYAAGTSVDGVPLLTILHVTRVESNRVLGAASDENRVMFLYGKCGSSPTPDQSCAADAQIHIWPICERNPAVETRQGVSLSVAPPVAPTDSTMRGVPARSMDFGKDGYRIELYTARVTIVVWGASRVLADDVVANLKPVNDLAASELGTGMNLPAPSLAALDGRVAC